MNFNITLGGLVEATVLYSASFYGYVSRFTGYTILILLLLNTQTIANANDALFTGITIQVDRFEVSGENPLSTTETQTILADYLGEHQGIEGVEAAANALESRLQKSGFQFFRVRVPSQSLKTGVIQLEMIHLPIGNIEVSGNRHFSKQNILNSLPTLKKDASAVDLQQAKHALDLANRNRAKTTRLTFSEDEEQEQLNARLQVKDNKPMELSFSVDNSGDEDTGDYRTSINFEHHNLFNRDHGLSLGYVVSPTEASSVDQYNANYRIPLYYVGDELNLGFSQSRSSSLGDLKGAGKVLSVQLTHFLPKHKDYQHQIDVSIQDKFFDNDTTPDDDTRDNNVRSRPVGANYQATLTTENSDTNFFIGYRKNLSGGDKNDDPSYDAARMKAKQNWSAITLGASVDYWLPKQWLLRSSIEGQLSNDTLISGEQFGFGGSFSLPGFEESEVIGDEGYQAKWELVTPTIYKRLQLFASYEVGYIKRNSVLLGQADSEDAKSIGLGLSSALGKKCDIRLQAGYVLDGVDDAFEGDSRTLDGDSKVHFNLFCNVL